MPSPNIAMKLNLPIVEVSLVAISSNSKPIVSTVNGTYWARYSASERRLD